MSLLSFLLCLLTLPNQVNSQQKPIPANPDEILPQAVTLNGLESSSSSPWHVAVSYDVFDQDGDNVRSGTFEEFYVSPKKYKQIFKGDTFNQIDIATEAGLYRSGDQRWPDAPDYSVRSKVLRPLYQARIGDSRVRPEKTELKFGDRALPCVLLRSTNENHIALGAPSFCFEPSALMLRYVQADLSERTIYNNFVRLQDRYVGRDIDVVRDDGKPVLKIHVDDVEEITNVDDGIFSPPPDSVGPIGGRIVLPSSVYIDEYQIADSMPVYPRGAVGKVNVKFVVGKDGRVIEASASDGPEKLQRAVLEAVRKYRFRPFLVLDQPVEVEVGTSFSYFERHR